tara:strand:+ start:18792 stop:19055 length:264 start_codon:yes stop_codon:yes gene_type:complete
MGDNREPAIIEAIYSVSLQYSIEEVEEKLGISWGDVKEFWVKWASLFVHMKDGSIREFFQGPELDGFDWKRPNEVIVLDSNFEEVSQ